MPFRCTDFKVKQRKIGNSLQFQCHLDAVAFLCLCYLCCWIVLRYEEAKAKGTDSYDRELEDVIDKLIGECDRKISKAFKRLEDEDAKAVVVISISEVT